MSQNQLPVPKQILEALREKNCVLYAGAGFSLESRLPDGSSLPTGAGLGFRLAQELYLEGHLSPEPTTDQQFDFANLAEDYETAYGRQRLIILLNEIYAADGLVAAEAHHQAIKFFPTIVTTNYDSLFEQASYLQGRRPIVVRRDRQLPFAGTKDRPTIIKIHGDLDDQETIIITNTDYHSHPLPDGLRDELRSIFSKKTVVFIGCGLADSDLQEVYFTVLERLGKLKPCAFVVTPFPAEDAPERKQWELSRKRWEQRGMQFLPGKASEFLNLVEDSLAVKKPDAVEPTVAALSAKDAQGLIAEYRRSLEKRVGTIWIFGEDEPRPLTKIFVELDVVEEYRHPEFNAEYLGLMDSEMRRRRELFSPDEERQTPDDPRERGEKVKRTIKSDELLRDRTQAVITGAPGSGKTTLLRYLTYRIVQEEKRLPVFLELKTVTAKDLENANYQLADLLFEKAVAALIPLHPSQGELLKESFFAKLAAGEAAILLDGLDEISGKDVSPTLFKSVNDFISRYKNCTLIISTRPYALQSHFDGAKEMEIAPLNQQQINQLIEHYYTDDAAALLQNLRARSDLRDMTRVPFLLSVIIGLHRNKEKIIESRLELYREIVVRLANKLDKEKALSQSRFHIVDTEGALKLDFLKRLSCERLLIDEVKAQSAEKETARLVFTGEELLKKAKQYVKQENLTSVAPHLLIADVKATPLLREVGADVYAFVHLTIMEYLAASALAEREDAEKIFCRAYFNTTLVEMEVLPMTLGLVNNADAFFTAIEQLPESLTYAGLRLRARGLRYGVQYNQQHLNRLADHLVDFIKGERVEEQPYIGVVANSFAAKGNSSIILISSRLIALLKDLNSDVRQSAAFALGKIGGEQAVAALIAALKDKDSNVRESAADALGVIGNDQSVAALIAALIEALKDGDHDVEGSAVEALGKIGGEKAVAALIEALKDENSDVRWSAAFVLGVIGGGQAVAALIEALKDKDSSVRWITVGALGGIRGEQAVAALFEALKDEDSGVRGSAANALGKVGGIQAVAALLEALKDEYHSVRGSAASALGVIGGEQVVAALIEALKDDDPIVHRSAASALGKIGGEKALAALLEALKDEDRIVRESAVEALGVIGGDQAVAALLEALKDEYHSVRGSAASALRAIGGDQVVAALIEALKDDDRIVRWSAADALGAIGAEQALAALIEALKDKYPPVRGSAVQALGKIGGEKAVAALLEAFKDTASHVRGKVAKAIGVIRGEKAVTALLGALKDKNLDVRGSAAEALTKFNDESLSSGFVYALSDQSDFVRQKGAQNVGYYCNDPQLLEMLTNLAANDPVDEVRSVASLSREAFIRKLQLFNQEAYAIDAAREIEREVTIEDNRVFIAQEVANTIKHLQETLANLIENSQRAELDSEHLAEAIELLRKQIEEASAMTNRFEEFNRQPQTNEELEAQIRAKYEQVKTADNSQAKGKTLEELAALLFSSIPGFILDGQNDRTSTEEIDVIIRNESRDPFWQRQGDLILIECKNWQAPSAGKKSKRVGKDEYVAFERKLKTRFGRCKLGIMVCAEGFARTIKQEMKTSSKEDALVVLINGDDLLAFVESSDRNTLLKQFVKKATLV